MILVVFGYSILIGTLLYVLIHRPARKYFLTVKTAASAAFVGIAIGCGIYGQNYSMLMRMLPAFLLCSAGDVLLGIYNSGKNKKCFLAGIAVFLLGHIFFIASFVSRQRLYLVDLIFPVLAVGITSITTRKEHMTLGRLRRWVYVYSFFVALLFSKSMHLLVAEWSTAAVCQAIGSGLFLISDYLILFLYFYEHRPWSIHGWNLVTYYYGIALLGMSLLYL